jgi:hypothetical protein
MMKTISVSGRWRCHRVRFVLREEPIAFYLCHCTNCQAESGSAFGQSMAVRRETIEAIEGPVRDHTIEHEGGRHSFVSYCGNCLTMMWGHSPEVPQVWGLNAGSLDSSADLRPYGNMWTRALPLADPLRDATLQSTQDPSATAPDRQQSASTG